MALKTSEVFGVSTHINEYSYVDRGNLDAEIRRVGKRNQHISLKGESKSGKSWLRQKNFPDAIVVQCRIGFSSIDVFISILAALSINLVRSNANTGSAQMEFSGSADIGWSVLAKAQAGVTITDISTNEVQRQPVGKDESDLGFICTIIKTSGRKVVIEDFHYLSPDSQRQLAHDLKAMWDYGVYVVLVGVWVKRNYLTFLNSDLAGRITEVSIYWNDRDLSAVIDKRCDVLNIMMSHNIKNRLVGDSFGNVGLLQSLVLETLDQAGVKERGFWEQKVDGVQYYEDAALQYAEQLEAVYLEFARRVSTGIRQRRGSTKIYAHTMWAVFESTDDELIQGVSVDKIFDRAYARQPRVQKGNLRSILRKIDDLQIDDRGKGLVVTFVEQSNSVATVDRGVLFYRKYCTVEWPWREIIDSLDEEGLDAD